MRLNESIIIVKSRFWTLMRTLKPYLLGWKSGRGEKDIKLHTELHYSCTFLYHFPLTSSFLSSKKPAISLSRKDSDPQFSSKKEDTI